MDATQVAEQTGLNDYRAGIVAKWVTRDGLTPNADEVAAAARQYDRAGTKRRLAELGVSEERIFNAAEYLTRDGTTPTEAEIQVHVEGINRKRKPRPTDGLHHLSTGDDHLS